MTITLIMKLTYLFMKYLISFCIKLALNWQVYERSCNTELFTDKHCSFVPVNICKIDFYINKYIVHVKNSP